MKKNLLVCCIAALFVGPVFADTATAIGSGFADAQAKAVSGGSISGVTQTFASSKPAEIPVPQVNPYAAPAGSPALFQLFSNNPTVAGITPTIAFDAMCGPTVFTAGNADVVIEGPGRSGKTNVQFAPRPGLAQSNGLSVTSVSTGIPDGTKVVCAGVLQVDATKSNTSMGIILNDARTFLLGKLQGYRHAYVVTVPEALAAALGVNTEGDGYSLGASGSGSGNPLSFLLGLFGSKSGISGATMPLVLAGTTVYVFLEGTPDEPGIVFKPKDIVQQPVPAPVTEANKPVLGAATQKQGGIMVSAASGIDEATRAKALDLAKKSAIK